MQTQPLRPGADRQAAAIGLPPAAKRGAYDEVVPPLDETRGRPVGAVVTREGGQKAQLESREKERAKLEAERNRGRAEELPQAAQPAAPPANPTSEH